MRRRSLLGLLPTVLILATMAAPAMASNVRVPPPPAIPTPIPRQGNSVLKVVPYYIHGGDVVHVSGDGFNPGTKIYLLFSCPSPFDLTEMKYQNWGVVFQLQGPTIDKHGRFVNFTWKAPVLHGVTQSSCGVYTRSPDGSTDYGPDIPGSYYTMPPKARLPKCSKQICADISEAPRTVHSGRYVTIRVRPGRKPGYTSWPGARATINVAYPGEKAVHRTATLNWEGWADLSFRVPSRITEPTKAKVSASFSMGSHSGRAQDEFVVVR